MVALLVAFIVLGGAGFLTFGAATEYTGSSDEVCLRDSDGVRTCSNPGRIGAEVLVVLGVESQDVLVTSESLLNTSRALFAMLVLTIGAVALRTRTTTGPIASTPHTTGIASTPDTPDTESTPNSSLT